MPNTNNNLLLLILKLTKKIKLLSILVRKTVAKPKKRCQNAKTIAHLFFILKQKIVAKAKKMCLKPKAMVLQAYSQRIICNGFPHCHVQLWWKTIPISQPKNRCLSHDNGYDFFLVLPLISKIVA